LTEGRPVLFDGATGTELERRGVHTGLPLWSTHALLEAPDVVRAVHAEYVAAGAEVITANTFRTQARVVGAGRAESLTRLAVELARSAAAAAGRSVFVAGSAPPLEDCYRPDLAPAAETCAAEHALHARALADAGCDFVLAETHNSVREAEAAAWAAAGTGLPFVVSFVAWEPGRILSGEPLERAIDAVRPARPLAVGVNCLPPSAVSGQLPVLAASGLAFGVYANLGEPEDERGFRRSESTPPGAYADAARAWLLAGARFLGGCCGTTPAHVAALRDLLAGAPASPTGS
jgi:S-methylmethionine-dependent homocysteine/selenocysteine methylase